MQGVAAQMTVTSSLHDLSFSIALTYGSKTVSKYVVDSISKCENSSATGIYSTVSVRCYAVL